jgi:cellulose synthase/poly-beta-1,6-N-acetylglucosamine synthase-like glycosyltransferase
VLLIRSAHDPRSQGSDERAAPLISIIIPAHNAGDHLDACLDAILPAPPEVTEIIVVDDASTDSTAQRACGRGVKVLAMESNRGPGPARNVGATAALGPLATIGLLNRRFYAFLRRQRGLLFALACFPLHACQLFLSGVGFLYASLEQLLGRRNEGERGAGGPLTTDADR